MNTRIKRHLKNVASLIAIISGLVGSLYAIIAFIQNEVEKSLQDEKTIRQIASKVRPTMIFNLKGSVVADAGAADLIESVNVSFTTTTNSNGRSSRINISITPKHHLEHAPILECLDGFIYNIQSERGKKFEWVFTFTSYSEQNADFVDFFSEPIDEKTRFKMEILY